MSLQKRHSTVSFLRTVNVVHLIVFSTILTLTDMHVMLLLLLSHFSRVQLCDPIDGSPPGSPVPGILLARTLEWVAISFFNACMHAKSLHSCLNLCDAKDSSPPGSSVHRIL